MKEGRKRRKEAKEGSQGGKPRREAKEGMKGGRKSRKEGSEGMNEGETEEMLPPLTAGSL